MQNVIAAPDRRLILILATALASALCGVWLASKWSQWLQAPSIAQPLTIGTLIEPARPLQMFSLLDHNGMEFSNANLQGHWSVMFFGFTHCPGVCPTTLAMLKSVSQSLDSLPEKQRPHIAFVSVDAKRDTIDVMKEYLLRFDPTFLGITGEQGSLDAFSAALGIPSHIVPMDDGDYMVDHSQALLVIDPHGRLRAIFNPPHDAALVASDYRRVVADGSSY